jgi:hypothetical protein
MTAREAKTQYQLKEWADRITNRSRSGQSIRAWCAENSISPRVYYYWLKRVREYAAQFLPDVTTRNTAMISVGQVAEPAAPHGWTVAEAAPPTSTQEITIEVGGCKITATAETDEALLLRVCRTLRQL